MRVYVLYVHVCMSKRGMEHMLFVEVPPSKDKGKQGAYSGR